MELKLFSGRMIGDGHPAYIIAEVGSNWKTLDDCLYSIRCAKACGADAVKFQLFNYEALYGYRPTWDLGPSRPRESALPTGWLPELKVQADEVGVDFMCSAFSPELVEAVNPFVIAHKVASAELTHVRILEKVRSLGKPIFLSTGASGAHDIQMARDLLQQGMQSPPLVLMYCVAAYPAKEVNLETIKALRSEFGTLVGYSDHSLDVLEIPRRAVELGASVVEKHFTALTGRDTPDGPHSLDADQFKRMVGSIRGSFSRGIGYTPEEYAMITRHNRRLIATRDIPVGEPLAEGQNFGIYRSLTDDTHAFSPWMVNEVNGKVTLKALKAGDGIGPGDV